MSEVIPFDSLVLKSEPTHQFRWLDRNTLQQLFRLHLKTNVAGLSWVEEWRTVPDADQS